MNDSLTTTDKEKRGCGRYALWALLVAIVLAAGGVASIFLPRLVNPATPTPSPTPRPPTVTVLSLRQLAELATVEMTQVADIEKEQVPDDFRKYLGGKERILMLVYGKVKAGFDLQKLEEDDLWTDGTRVQLTLPPPEILSVEIDFDNTRIITYERSFFVGNDPNLQAALLEEAQAALKEAAIKAGILDLAAQYGQVFFENHLRSLGFEDVRVYVE